MKISDNRIGEFNFRLRRSLIHGPRRQQKIVEVIFLECMSS